MEQRLEHMAAQLNEDRRAQAEVNRTLSQGVARCHEATQGLQDVRAQLASIADIVVRMDRRGGAQPLQGGGGYCS